jgi:hypothetical protein
MLVAAHGTVGLQHASMALYNAWCDRVPVYLVIGNYNDAAVRRPAEWYHGVQDAALMVRDFTKWDDTPWSLTHFAESAVRAYNVAVTPPMAPVVLVLDGILQEQGVDINKLPAIPKTPVPAAPQGDSASVEQAARMLVAAESPCARRRSSRTHTERHEAAGRARRAGGRGRRRPDESHELPDAAPAESKPCARRRRLGTRISLSVSKSRISGRASTRCGIRFIVRRGRSRNPAQR